LRAERSNCLIRLAIYERRGDIWVIKIMNDIVETLGAFKTLPVSTVILDSAGAIVGVNKAWQDFGERNGLRLPNFGIGANYLSFCGSEQQTLLALKDLLAGRRDLVTLIYPCNSRAEQRWFFLIGFPLSLSEPSGTAIVHADLTSLVPLPIFAHIIQTKADQEGPQDSSAILEAIAGTVEELISNSVVSQLNVMLMGSRRSLSRKLASQTDDLGQISPCAHLSKRQMDVLQLLGEGKTNEEIAKALARSPHTIKLHVSAILRQLNVKSRTQAALLASKLPRK